MIGCTVVYDKGEIGLTGIFILAVNQCGQLLTGSAYLVLVGAGIADAVQTGQCGYLIRVTVFVVVYLFAGIGHEYVYTYLAFRLTAVGHDQPRLFRSSITYM